jgi:transketolase
MSTLELKYGKATREAYGEAVVEAGRSNPKVVALDADLCKSTFSAPFAKEFPERFWTAGIAEANMCGIASGLALSGKIPFASSFATFLCCKGFDQIRMCVAYPNLNAKFVGSHGGISIGEDGPSQQAIEDFAIMSSLAGFVVLCPSDEFCARALVHQMAGHVGPCYMRTGRAKAPILYSADEKFEIGKAKVHGDGKDAAIIACGFEVGYALQAQAALAETGIHVRVLDMHTLKPMDDAAVEKAARECGAIVTAEEHLLDGGLGSMVARSVASSCPVPMEYVGLNNVYAECGTPDQLMERYKLTAPFIAEAVKKVIARKK